MSQVFSVWIALTCVTLATRILPLFFSSWLEKQKWMDGVSRYLPCMIITLMVLHDVVSRSVPTIALIALAVTAAMHWWKRQVVLSIIVGVATYTISMMI